MIAGILDIMPDKEELVGVNPALVVGTATLVVRTVALVVGAVPLVARVEAETVGIVVLVAGIVTETIVPVETCHNPVGQTSSLSTRS